MSSKLNMLDIVDFLVANFDIDNEEADNFINGLFSTIEKGLSSDELVKIKDFGTFKLTQIQERESIDVNTKEKIVIPSHHRISFLPSPTLKNVVNKPFAHFETIPLNEGVFIDGIQQDSTADEGSNHEQQTDEVELINEETTEIESPSVAVIEESDSNEQKIEVVEEDSAVDLKPNENAPIIPITLMEPPVEHKEKISAAKNSSVRSTKKPKTKKKLRNYILRWDIAIALFIIIGLGFAYNYYFVNHNPCKKGVEESEIPQPIREAVPVEASASESSLVVDSLETMEAAPRKMVKMSPNRTLRLIALDKFGNREFWVYIYLTNQSKIKDPNVVPVGLELELPRDSEYQMDANNPEHIATARKMGDDVMRGF